MSISNEPEIPPYVESEVAAEAILYAQIFNEQCRMLISVPESRTRARAAVEDFRESRILAKLNRPETRQ